MSSRFEEGGFSVGMATHEPSSTGPVAPNLLEGGYSMQIKVIYPDGSTGWVDSTDLDDLIDRREIIAFERANGLAWIAKDPIRKKRRPKESDRYSIT